MVLCHLHGQLHSNLLGQTYSLVPRPYVTMHINLAQGGLGTRVAQTMFEDFNLGYACVNTVVRNNN